MLSEPRMNSGATVDGRFAPVNVVSVKVMITPPPPHIAMPRQKKYITM